MRNVQLRGVNASFKSVRSSVRAAVRGEYYNVQARSQRPKGTRSP